MSGQNYGNLGLPMFPNTLSTLLAKQKKQDQLNF